jgi:hypothetical protein
MLPLDGQDGSANWIMTQRYCDAARKIRIEREEKMRREDG